MGFLFMACALLYRQAMIRKIVVLQQACNKIQRSGSIMENRRFTVGIVGVYLFSVGLLSGMLFDHIPSFLLLASDLWAATSTAGPTIPLYAGPTDNITKVANALQLKAKSLTIQVTVAPGLALTQPVTISIAYVVLKSGGGSERLTQTYDSSTGNRFVNWDGEGDGHPRRVHLDITLSEPNPGGGMYSYNVPVDMDLDPLYDVTIGPLTFKLFTDCDVIGDSEIRLHWIPPDSVATTTPPQFVSFSTGANQIKTISAFRWNRAEVSASAKLHKVIVWFTEHDPPGPITYTNPRLGNYDDPLVPDKTQPVGYTIPEENGQHCSAWIQYTIMYHVHRYPSL
jgi:hypothetical protein